VSARFLARCGGLPIRVMALGALLATAPLLAAPDSDWHIRPDDAELARPVSHPDYQRLAAAHERYRQLVADGGWPVLPAGLALQPGQRDPAVRTLRELLRATGDFRSEVGADPWFFDAALRDALKAFQSRHGLPLTGWLDPATLSAAAVPAGQRLAQLELALERWRWLPRELGDRYLWVNLPAAQLKFVDNGETVMEMPAIIGHPRRPTPTLRSEVSAVVFRPDWTVPRSLAVEDLLPVQQRDPEFLTRQRIRVLHQTFRGPREVTPAQVPWERLGVNYFPYVLVQEPGPDNSLGLVKFQMDNPFDIYLHDTPARGFFRLNSRTLSAGCVRLADPLGLADAILARDRGGWPAGEAARRSASSAQVRLQQPLPVYLVYLTAWVDEAGALQFRPDVYGREVLALAR
jgi:murein L,D-transpeptidase YcbB/YkuD